MFVDHRSKQVTGVPDSKPGNAYVSRTPPPKKNATTVDRGFPIGISLSYHPNSFPVGVHPGMTGGFLRAILYSPFQPVQERSVWLKRSNKDFPLWVRCVYVLNACQGQVTVTLFFFFRAIVVAAVYLRTSVDFVP